MIEFHGNAAALNDVDGLRAAAPKRTKFEKHIPLDVMDAQLLRHATAINRIDHLLVHKDGVL